MTPGHLTICNIPLGFTVRVDQADCMDWLSVSELGLEEEFAPGLQVPVGYGSACVVFFSVVFSLLILTSSPRSAE